MTRFDLPDSGWSMIARCSTRFSGLCEQGAPWADIPARYEPYTTCVNRFYRLRQVGH